MERVGGVIARFVSCTGSGVDGITVSSVSLVRGIKSNSATHKRWTLLKCGNRLLGIETCLSCFMEVIEMIGVDVVNRIIWSKACFVDVGTGKMVLVTNAILMRSARSLNRRDARDKVGTKSLPPLLGLD